MQEQNAERIDLAGLVADLNGLLRLKTTVIGMKLFAQAAEMEAIPKIRRPNAIHTTDQIVSMAARLGWTVGITAEDLVGAQCRAVIGLAPQDEKWLAGENYVGVWHGTAEDARRRQEALDVVPFGQYQALAVSHARTRGHAHAHKSWNGHTPVLPHLHCHPRAYGHPLSYGRSLGHGHSATCES